MEQIANADFNQLEYDDVFSSTNSLCPIKEITLSQGSQYFDYIEIPNQSSIDQYGFEVSLKSQYVETQSTYFYTMTAVAEGSASAS